MAQPKLIITLGAGGLGRPLPGEDFISGFSYYAGVATLPAGFGADRIKQIFSLKEAEDLGITKGHADWGTLHYQLQEFYRIQTQGNLFVQITDGITPGTIADYDAHDFAEIETLRRFAEGKIRQIGVFQVEAPFAAVQVTALDAQAKTARAEGQPLSIIYGSDISAVSDLTTLPDLRALDAELCSVVIGQDGDGEGAAIATASSASCVALGALLGAVSLSAVNESIAWPEKFNLITGAELQVAAFGNGDLWKLKAPALLDAINDKGYIFLKKFTQFGFGGTYFQNNPTAVAITSDYAFINDNRVIDKASRFIVQRVLPKLNSPLQVNADGTLFEDTVAVFKGLTSQALEHMVKDQEISAFDVIIDPTQNVLSTSKLMVTVKIVPVGVARTIEFVVGYALNV